MPYVRLSAEEKARRKAVRDQINADKKEARQLILEFARNQKRADIAEDKARIQAIKEQNKMMKANLRVAKVAMRPAEKSVMKSTFIGPLLPTQRKRLSKAERLINYTNKRNEVLARQGLPPISFPGMVPNIIPEAVPSILPPRMGGEYNPVPVPRVRRPRRARAPRAPPAPIARAPASVILPASAIPRVRLPSRPPSARRVFPDLESNVFSPIPPAPAPRGLGAPAPLRVRRPRFLGAPAPAPARIGRRQRIPIPPPPQPWAL